MLNKKCLSVIFRFKVIHYVSVISKQNPSNTTVSPCAFEFQSCSMISVSCGLMWSPERSECRGEKSLPVRTFSQRPRRCHSVIPGVTGSLVSRLYMISLVSLRENYLLLSYSFFALSSHLALASSSSCPPRLPPSQPVPPPLPSSSLSRPQIIS